MNHKRQRYVMLAAAILLCLKAVALADGGLGITSVTQGPADLAVPPDVPAGEKQRYGLGFPFQVSPTMAAVLVNLRMEGTGVGDFENGSDVVLFHDLSKITGDAPVRVARNDKWTTSSGEKRILVKFPDIGGFVPLGATRPDGSPHPYAGTGFSFCEALEFPMTEDGKFSWEAKSLHQVEIHQLAFDGQTFRVVGSDLRRQDRPMMIGDSGWHLVMPGLIAAIPDGDDLLQAVQARGHGMTACGIVRWRPQSGVWQPVSFARVTVGCSEPTLIRDIDGTLLVTARTYGDDFNAVRVWRSGDHGASWTTAIHVPQIREPVPLSINRAADGTPYVATNPLGHGRGVLKLWPLDAGRAKLEEPLVANEPRKGLSQGVDHPTSATLRLADGKWHHVLVYRMRLGGEDRTGARRVGCCIEEVFSRGTAIPAWQFAEPPNTAIVPVPKLENDSYDWYARHESVLEAKDQIDPEIVMIGDSITHFWAGPPESRNQRGPRAWKELLLPNGELPSRLMSDFCHPTEEGYAIWAAALKPLLQDAGSRSGVGADLPEPEKISIWSGQAPVGDGQFEAANATITVHRPAPDTATGAAIVICPGGGYGGLVTGAEGHGIAKWLNGHGIAGIVLEYRLPKGRPFVPLLDAQRAIRTVRSNAGQWAIDPGHIGIIGFSAGGHLASTAWTHFDSGDPHAADPINRVSSRPDFVILIYPVVTMGEKTHGGSKANLLGRDPKPDLVELFSNEKQVTDQTPPMFLAHAQDDKAVVPDNSRMLFESLQAHKVATEYLELPSGGHGLNGYKGPMWDAWQVRSLEWLAAQKLIPARDSTPPANP